MKVIEYREIKLFLNFEENIIYLLRHQISTDESLVVIFLLFVLFLLQYCEVLEKLDGRFLFSVTEKNGMI